MKYRLLLLTLPLILSCMKLAGQHKYSIKLYQNIDYWRYDQIYFSVKYFDGYNIDVENETRYRLSLALVVNQDKKLFHELELSVLPLTSLPPVYKQYLVNPPGFNDRSYFYSALNYELNYVLATTGIVHYSLGLGFNPHWIRYENKHSEIYPYYRENSININYQLIPRISFDLSERLGLDINAKVSYFKMTFLKSHYDHPQLPQRLRYRSMFTARPIPDEFVVRVGLSYAI